MEQDMGYTNSEAVYDLSRDGRFLERKNDQMRLNLLALQVLAYMAHVTYDWDVENNRPPAKTARAGRACRYYSLGWRNVAEGLGMISLTPEQIMGGGAAGAVDDALSGREHTARNRISRAWGFLRGQGLLKRLRTSTVGHNAGYLLMLGDAGENAAVEKWARRCLAMEDAELRERG